MSQTLKKITELPEATTTRGLTILAVENGQSVQLALDRMANPDLTQIEQMLARHDEQLNPFKVTLGAPAVVEYNPITTQVARLTITAKRGEQAVTPDTLTITANGQPVGDITAVPLTRGRNTFQLTATYQGRTAAATATTTLIGARRAGANQATTITPLQAQQLPSRGAATHATMDIQLTTTSPFYLWIAIPDTLTLTKVTSSGFGVPIEQPTTISILGEPYKAYRSSNQIEAGTHTFNIQ